MTKEEKRVYYANYRKKNRDKILEYQREWYAKNRESVCLMRKAQYIRKKKKNEIKVPPTMPRKFYNKVSVYAIKSPSGYICKLVPFSYSYNLWNAYFFKNRENAEYYQKQVENAEIVKVELREQKGVQEMLNYWHI